MSKTSRQLTYISIFSGIEAASVSWEPLGFKPVAFAEVDPFPSAVLKERYPHVPNLGDITKIDWSEYRDKVDIVVGGSPCQSFSVAGKREGLAGESGLMFEYIRCVREVRPRSFVWENVPGALSSEKGEAFRQLLSEMDELGYGMVWRVYDAQFTRIPMRDADGSFAGWFGPVAQRRRRVFLVGCLGDPKGAAEILFEPESLRWDHPSSREKRKELTRAAGQRSSEGGQPGERTYCIQGDIARGAHMGQNGCGYSEDGASYTLNTIDRHAVAFTQNRPPTTVIDRAAFNQGANAQYNPHIEETDVMDTLVARGPHAVMCMASGQANAEIETDMTPAQAARQYKDPQIVCMAQYGEDVAGTLMAKADSSPCHDKGANVFTDGYVVRRLTPLECERLQGFPDNWTKIPYKGKPAEDCPDTPRYKALGNSMAVPVMRLIGTRIQAYWERSRNSAPEKN